MAGVKRENYTFNFGGASYAVRLPATFYTNIDSTCGFTKADDVIKGKFRIETRDALRNGALVQIGILYLKGNRLVRSKILCATEKVTQAIQSLEGKEYRGFTIRNAYFTTRRRLG